jgi:hypothetical protein
MFVLVQRVTRKHSFRAAPRALAISALIVGSLGVTVALAGPAAGSGGVTLYVNSGGSDAGNDCTQLLAPCATVSYAVSQAATGDTIEVVGTIEDNFTVPSTISTLTISGDEAPAASPAVLDGAGSGTVVTVANGSNVTLNYLTVQNGSTSGSGGGIENNGTLTVDNSTVTGNSSTGANGAGIDNTGTLTVSSSTISDNTANQNGGGISSEGGTVTVSDSTISGNSAGADGGGVDLASSPGLITDSTITDNTAASGGGIDNGSGSLTVIDATISSNSNYGIVGSVTTGATIVAYDTPTDCQSALTSTGYDLSADSSCGFTAAGDREGVDPQLGGLTDNGGPTETLLPASGPAVGVIPNSTSVDSVPVCGGTSDQRGVNRPFGGSTCNIGAVESYPGIAPSISNIPQATFDVGKSSSFQFTTGFAAPSAIFTETGALPAGVTLNRAGVLTGSPPAAAVGTYPIVVTASNGVTPVSTQDFTLMVDMPQVFPPSNLPYASFLDGSPNTFTFMATGTPTPEVTAKLASGLKLPLWLSVHPGAGSATLSGTPPVGTKHIYVFTVTATNTATATQTFTLTVGYAPKFLSLAAKTFKTGSLLNQIFASRTSGYPAPTITETGQLPNGLSFSPLPNGKSEIIGIAQPGSGGVYDISLAATNVFGTVTQQVVLTVDEKPTITSPASATVTHGTPISIAVDTSHAYPAVTNITETSALPPGVTFTYTGNGTGMLAGTPTAVRVTPYRLQFVALTPIAHAAQTFYLTVN